MYRLVDRPVYIDYNALYGLPLGNPFGPSVAKVTHLALYTGWGKGGYRQVRAGAGIYGYRRVQMYIGS